MASNQGFYQVPQGPSVLGTLFQGYNNEQAANSAAYNQYVNQGFTKQHPILSSLLGAGLGAGIGALTDGGEGATLLGLMGAMTPWALNKAHDRNAAMMFNNMQARTDDRFKTMVPLYEGNARSQGQAAGIRALPGAQEGSFTFGYGNSALKPGARAATDGMPFYGPKTPNAVDIGGGVQYEMPMQASVQQRRVEPALPMASDWANTLANSLPDYLPATGVDPLGTLKEVINTALTQGREGARVYAQNLNDRATARKNNADAVATETGIPYIPREKEAGISKTQAEARRDNAQASAYDRGPGIGGFPPNPPQPNMVSAAQQVLSPEQFQQWVLSNTPNSGQGSPNAQAQLFKARADAIKNQIEAIGGIQKGAFKRPNDPVRGASYDVLLRQYNNALSQISGPPGPAAGAPAPPALPSGGGGKFGFSY